MHNLKKIYIPCAHVIIKVNKKKKSLSLSKIRLAKKIYNQSKKYIANRLTIKHPQMKTTPKQELCEYTY